MDVETCRICANFYVTTSGVEFVNLFQPEQENLQSELNFIINEISAWELNITPDDGLPQRICANCFSKFCTIYAFRKECETAQNMLRKALETQEQICDATIEATETTSPLDFAQQLYVVQATDSNGNVAENVESTIPEISVNSSKLAQVSTDAVIVSPDFAVNYNINYDVNVPTNFLISNDGIMAPAIDETSANGNIVATVQENRINAETTYIENSSQDLEEMLAGSIIPKKHIKGSPKIIAVKRKANSSENPIIQDESSEDEDDIFDEKPAQRIANFSFACNYCYCPPVGPIGHLIFKSNDALSQHFFDIHDPKLPYPCPKCPKLFSSSRRRNSHVSKLHSVTTHRIIRCPYCHKVIRTPLEIHEISCTYISDWKCKVCERDFRQMPLHSFRAHQRSHYTNPKFRCEICKRDFMRRSNFETHKKMHAEPCLECNEFFPSVAELKKHNLTVHDGKPLFRCIYCGKDFSSFAYLQRHIENLHSHEYKKDFNKTTCSNCYVTFPTKLKLHFHQQRPKDENGQCILQYSQKSRSRYFCCPHCTKRFTTKDQLDFHIEIHDARLCPHACDKCTVRCRTALELQQHINFVHMNLKDFACDKCDERFGYKRDLENHKLYHSKLTLKCSLKDCNATYMTADELNQHIHSEHELVSCECCNKVFTQNELKEHQNSKTCLTNMNDVTRATENTFNIQNKNFENQIETVSSTTCNNGNVFVQLINDQQQSIVLKEDLPPSEQIHQDVLDFLQSATDENIIHAPDVPLNDDDYFISSLLDPDNEIIVS